MYGAEDPVDRGSAAVRRHLGRRKARLLIERAKNVIAGVQTLLLQHCIQQRVDGGDGQDGL